MLTVVGPRTITNGATAAEGHKGARGHSGRNAKTKGSKGCGTNQTGGGARAGEMQRTLKEIGKRMPTFKH